MDWDSFVNELKRRKVFRVAVAYAVVSFAVLQAADLIFPAILLPEWTFRLLVILTLLGAPIALVLAWAFDITTEGVKRTDDSSPPDDAQTPIKRRSVVAVALAFLILVVGGLVARDQFGRPDQVAENAETVSAIDPPTPTIAVLPFDNLSEEIDTEYFSDGVAEDILTSLAMVPGLRVISRQSMMQYKDSEKSMQQIATELGATHVVEGSARRSADQVRVTAKLVDARSDRQLWAESYDRELSAAAIFRIQTEVAERVADALEARLSSSERVRLADPPTTDLTAYDYYLRGREHDHAGTIGDYRRAIAFFHQAIEIDPDYALAWAALSGVFTAMEGAHGLGEHWLDSARIAAERAIELDPDAAAGHASLALFQWNAGQPLEAIRNYGRALELRPNDPRIHWGLAFIRWRLGELDAALRSAEIAASLGPTSPGAHALLARCYWALGDYARAESALRRALQLQPDFPWAHEDLIWLYIVRGRYDEAEQQLGVTEALLPGSPEFLLAAAWLALRRDRPREARAYLEGSTRTGPERTSSLMMLGRAYLALGEEALARETFASARALLAPEADQLGPDDGRVAAMVSMIAVALDQREEALDWLQAAYDHGWRGWPWVDIAREPDFEPLYGEPRFQELRAGILRDVERMADAARMAPEGAG